MMQLNKIGAELGKLKAVKALTDVTGFGLLGHLAEVCEGSNLTAEINFDKVPRLPQVDEYLAQKSVPGGTNRNWDSYGHKIGPITAYQKQILCDPQTSGGLLVAIEPESCEEVFQVFREFNLDLTAFGKLCARKPEPEPYIIIN